MAIIDGHGLCEAASTVLGRLVELVEVTSATMSTAGRIRVNFDRGMKKDAKLSNRLNYAITPVSPGAVSPYVEEVEVPDVAAPEYVELLTSEHTDGATYDVTVNSNGPLGVDNLRVDETRNTESYTGVGVTPTIDSVVAVSENRVDVIFSENMTVNDDIKNPLKYSFDNGLSVLSVLEVVGNTAKLVTTDQAPGTIYTLTVDP